MKSRGVYAASAERQKCGFAEMKLAGETPVFVKLQRPPPEIRIFSARRLAWSTRTTRKPRCPATAAAIMPAAPAPMTARSKCEALTGSDARCLDAIDVIALLAVFVSITRQAVHIGFKPGELGIEFTRELQIIDDTAVETLARNKQRNTRRIRCQQNAGDTAFEVVDIDTLGFPMGHLCVCIRGLHSRNHIAKVNLGSQACKIVLAIGLVNLLAQVAQTHFLVAAVCLAEVGQNAPHRLITIVIVFELLQRSEQSIPTPFCNANSEQNKEGIQAGFFNHHTVLGQVF